MIKVFGYNTISILPNVMELKEIELPTAEKSGDYCVDTSHFVPRAESVLSLKAGDVPSQQLYDFPNGKASNVPMPSNRRHSYTGDIAEASVASREARANADDSISKAKYEFDREQLINGNTASQTEAAPQSQS